MFTVNALSFNNFCKPPNGEYKNLKTYPQTNCSKSEVSFNGMSRNTFLSAAYLASVAVAGVFMANAFTVSLMSSSKIEDQINESQVSKSNGWGKNLRVLASNGQNITSETRSNKITNEIISSYSQKLISNLKRDEIDTIEDANEALKNGYFVINKKYYALETIGNKLNIFNKKETGKQRFVLICSQSDDEYSETFNSLKDEFKNDIKKIYNIPEDNIVRVSTKGKSGFRISIKEIKNKLKNISKADVELLVVYFGHGGALAQEKGSDKIEGNMEGIILNDLREEEAKLIFKENFSDIKTLFMLQTCHAGAWIADNSKKAVKIFDRFV